MKLFVSPNRVNLRLSVHKVPRLNMLKHLDWLVDMIKQHEKDTPKTIIFCDTLYSVASVMYYMTMTLGEGAFHPRNSRKHEHCLLGIFHSLSLKEYKERLLLSFNGQGLRRVAIATTALSMGVHFPDVRYVVHFGPAGNLLDFHQQAGRAGWDGNPSDIIVLFYGRQLSHCEDDIRSFLKKLLNVTVLQAIQVSTLIWLYCFHLMTAVIFAQRTAAVTAQTVAKDHSNHLKGNLQLNKKTQPNKDMFQMKRELF